MYVKMLIPPSPCKIPPSQRNVLKSEFYFPILKDPTIIVVFANILNQVWSMEYRT
jgi:hypothetical protein